VVEFRVGDRAKLVGSCQRAYGTQVPEFEAQERVSMALTW